MPPYGKAEFERRVFPRFKLDIPVYFELETRPPLPQEARAENISEGGLRMTVPHPLAVGERLRVKLHLTDPKAPRVIEAVGSVVWARPGSGPAAGQTLVGLRFDQIRPEDMEFVRQFENLWLQQEG